MWRDLLALPVAAACGAALAFRPVRRGTPARDPAVIQTQIVLAVVGALIMLVVGASIARAFGALGAASLVRYRAKIDDPKDAAVMLTALAVGLAAGAGVYLPALAATAFILLVLWTLESIEPAPTKSFMLKVKGGDSGDIQPDVERLLREQRISYELRATGQDELEYQVRLPARKRTDRVANAIKALDHERKLAVELDAEKSNK
ncbi:MAG TPA: MgtC/SapB family protein [Gemmatimonadales bacterium]|nr:MgtC/SapB family protein [Gemmatimonadales bacterium]